GWDKQLVKILTGREVPAGKRSADIGVIVHNVATAYAIHEAIRYSRPLVSRIVTVSGDAVETPRNVEVRIGTLVSEILEYSGLSADDYRLVMGGPMMGHALPHSNVPVVKGCNGLVVLTNNIAPVKSSQPCIRCGKCIEACPVGLLPLEMVTRVKKGEYKRASEIGLRDCISCASCSFVCPANIPLVHYFNFAKGELKDQQIEKIKSDKTRKLTEAKKSRMEAAERAKKEAAAARKAQRAAEKAKKAAQAEQQKASS
ncbi:MAG: RnfABCDGE type electron transport complex subunit C, partial [Gammaproteobacteria bacterium]|nr:RnfABCDGE type electron transport complex subunit C [Gammaproteobacteria bacterium]